MTNILDELAKLPMNCRHLYSIDPTDKPNNHCYWDVDWGAWMENDEHYRKRLNGEDVGR